MTADIVNLRRYKKRKAREVAASDAAAARARSGRSKAERRTTSADIARREGILDGARLDPRHAGPAAMPQSAESAGFPAVAAYDADDGLDPGNVS